MLRFPSLRRLALVGVSLVAPTLLAAACSSGGGQPAAKSGAGASADEIRLTTSEFKFEPGTISVPTGKPITLVLDNKGALEHDIHVDTLGIKLHADPKKTARQTITLDKAGTFEFDCTIPGHKESGMKGKLVAS